MKLISFIAALMTVCLLLSSCSEKNGKVDQTSDDIGIFELQDSDSKKSDTPFAEGCYEGNNYVLELVFSGNSVENNYSVVLFRRDTGAVVFTGTAFDVDEKASEFNVFANNGTGMKLTIVKLEEKSIAARMAYGDKKAAYVSGEYKYAGEKYIPENRINEESLSEGVYRSDNGVYSLIISEEEKMMSFIITDTFEKRSVFEGRLSLGFSDGNDNVIKSVVLLNVLKETLQPQQNTEDGPNGDEKIEITKNIVNGIMCVDVTEHSTGKNKDYFGRYYYENPEYLENGEYTFGEFTLKLSLATDKNKIDLAEGYRHIEKIVLTDKNGEVIFEGAKKLKDKEKINSAAFGADGKNIIFFKGFDKDGEYVELMNSGYIDGIGVNERYRLK